MASVSIRGLDKSFGETVVLKDVNIEVADGAFAVLVGPSGCGKSTLLRLIAGLEEASSGSISFDGREVTALQPRERDVAMVFQSYALYPHLTVFDNLAFGLKLRKSPKAEIARRVAEVSAMLGLDPLLERMPRALSGGQRQRVAMGRAIVRRPQIYLFDEPLSNLDAALRAQVRVDIRENHAKLGTTSIYVTHDQVEAMTLADVMFILNEGRVEQSGRPIDLYERPATRFVASFLGSPHMNFIAGQVVDGRAVRCEGAIFDLEPEDYRLDGVKEVAVGIRPHDLHPRQAGALQMDVDFIEQLGGETYAYGRLGDQKIVVRLEAETRIGRADQIALHPTRLHLFDPVSGDSLRC